MLLSVVLLILLPAGEEQRLEAAVVDLVGLLLDGDDAACQRIEAAGVAADRAQQRHRFHHQLCRLHDDRGHFLHRRLEGFDLEHRDGLGDLVRSDRSSGRSTRSDPGCWCGRTA